MSSLSTRDVARARARSHTDVFDGLRGIAIALVVAFHTWLFSWYTPDLHVLGIAVPLDVVARTGYLGVELFFFISAFVLFFPVVERRATGEPEPRLAGFAYRRALKILPSYAIALVATSLSVRSLHLHVPLGAALAQHALLVQNFFSSDFGQANSVFWSLAVEVQFYCVFPALAWAFVRQPVLTPLVMTGAALAYRYAVAPCCLLVETVNRQVPAFLDVFAVGMLCAYGVSHLRRRPALVARLRPAFALVAIVAVVAAFALMRSANAVTYDLGGRERWLLVDRTAFAATMGALAFGSAFAYASWRRALANPVFVFLSLVSYNLYLWHTLVMIWLWKGGAIPSATPDPHDDGRWKFVFIVVGWTLSLGIATAITYFVERPLLATAKPQAFAFDWRRIRPESVPTASRETRT